MLKAGIGVSISKLCGPTGAMAGGGWAPTDLDNLELWLDASDGTTVLTDVDGVYQWTDKSGIGNHAIQNTGSKKPEVFAAEKNGLDTIGRDGIDDYLEAPCSSTGSGFTFYVAGDDLHSPNSVAAFSFNGSFFYPRINENGVNTIQLRGGSNQPNLTTPNNFTGPILCSLASEASYQKAIAYHATIARFEGNSTDADGPGAGTALGLFNRHGEGGSYLGSNGRFYEFILYLEAHDETTMEIVLTYLNDKWAIY
jgi:hypothetical protein